MTDGVELDNDTNDGDSSSLIQSTSLSLSTTTTSFIPQQPERPQPPIPVDRQWIAKLLQKYPNPNARRHDKALVCAPMVDQSDLPFRLLCRRYGTNLCYTPMIHAKLAATNPRYRQKFMGTWLQQDRPLIVQICGSNPEYVLQTARFVEPFVDGIDINCGCPQQIAKKGNYGAFLLEQEETLLTLVRHLVRHLTVPLSIKVRLLPPPDSSGPPMGNFDVPSESLKLYQKLVDAGIHLLTIHGRTRKQKSDLTGHSDWETIGKAVKLFGDRIPIFANGSIQDYDDVEECLKITGADGVMSSESLLEYPPLFYKVPQTPVRTIGRIQLAQEYMDLARQYPPQIGGQGSGLKCVRMHMHRFLHKDLQYSHPQLRQRVCWAKSNDDLQQCLDDLKLYHQQDNHHVGSEALSWYRRWRDEQPKVAKMGDDDDEEEEEDSDYDVDECGNNNGAIFFDGNKDDGDY
ncbi:tRNA-U20-dihydrouridine synthase [Nitzschia inconspicua]|uniref:tRNA-U20-dihydrouridine synthase n=1 Tax=Nitzschia inconspicua TaxID=303405 RepID=A0A9K3LP99_9STRA|nr:tRNA-U20-dihydrouridine synthase [Nitzschia inconspicua]